MEHVYAFENYKDFVHSRIENSPNKGRGVRRKLAQTCRCQVAYISHVLAGDKDFSLEQAEAVARFFKLREDELEYFVLLVSRARAGTVELRKHLDRQLTVRRQQYQEIKKRIHIEDSISEQDQSVYFSSWHFQAIHSILTIPDVKSADEISKRLGLSIERVNEILLFLMSKGLVRETNRGYEATEKHFHLPRTSPLIGKLHANWRVQTLSSLDHIRKEDLHYSGLVTLSGKDAIAVREILTKALSNAIDVVKPSKEEKLCLLAMDFYEI